MTDIINIGAPNWHFADSYGRVATELRNGLIADGYHVNQYRAKHGPQNTIKMAFGGLLLGYPTLYKTYGVPLKIGPRIAVTMFESSQIPPEWVEPLNECDAVIVPAQFLVKVFRDCGVTVPVHVVPLGVSQEFARYSERYQANSPFTVLAIADRGRRKGWHEAAQAFIRAFGDDSRYKLILKARGLPMWFTNPNVELVTGDLSNKEMADLYRRAHVMLFPSRGEGFGLPPREFAATGGLAIATEWGGVADDLRQWGLPIPYTPEPAWKDHGNGAWFGKLGHWANPDVEAMSDLLKHVAKHYDDYRGFRVQAAGFVLSQYRWQSFARGVKAIWEQVLEEHYGNHDHAEVAGPVASETR